MGNGDRHDDAAAMNIVAGAHGAGRRITPGDFDADGDLDHGRTSVFGHSNDVSVILNIGNGDGTFAAWNAASERILNGPEVLVRSRRPGQ